jgi:hypothetical protein
MQQTLSRNWPAALRAGLVFPGHESAPSPQAVLCAITGWFSGAVDVKISDLFVLLAVTSVLSSVASLPIS